MGRLRHKRTQRIVNCSHKNTSIWVLVKAASRGRSLLCLGPAFVYRGNHMGYRPNLPDLEGVAAFIICRRTSAESGSRNLRCPPHYAHLLAEVNTGILNAPTMWD